MAALAALGSEGMSSDEDEGVRGDGVRAYGIVRKEWRSAKLARFLQIITAFGLKYTAGGPGGSFRHRYGPTDRVSVTRPVAGLPINFYDATWLKRQSEFELRRLAPKGAEYDLTIPNDILT